MNQRIALIIAATLLASPAAFASGTAQWKYSGHEGPEHWGELAPEFAACAKGVNQSPIDLKGAIEADLRPIKFDYASQASEILNNGHTIQANFAPGSTIKVDGMAFELKQVHFHAPSENLINGKSYPLEGHLVHANKDGHLAVVAVMYDTGKANAGLAALWKQMPAEAGSPVALAAKVKGKDLLPARRDYYRFNGSLTTPPCSEGVRWLVMKDPVTASRAQIEQFSHVMHHPNNRPVQPVNARPVLQ
ncbi:MAG: carbonic anhydrase family protein [Sulfuricella sp.]